VRLGYLGTACLARRLGCIQVSADSDFPGHGALTRIFPGNASGDSDAFKCPLTRIFPGTGTARLSRLGCGLRRLGISRRQGQSRSKTLCIYNYINFYMNIKRAKQEQSVDSELRAKLNTAQHSVHTQPNTEKNRALMCWAGKSNTESSKHDSRPVTRSHRNSGCPGPTQGQWQSTTFGKAQRSAKHNAWQSKTLGKVQLLHSAAAPPPGRRSCRRSSVNDCFSLSISPSSSSFSSSPSSSAAAAAVAAAAASKACHRR
jgi:hypothetical protein